MMPFIMQFTVQYYALLTLLLLNAAPKTFAGVYEHDFTLYDSSTTCWNSRAEDAFYYFLSIQSTSFCLTFENRVNFCQHQQLQKFGFGMVLVVEKLSKW